ncbi:3-oxoacyl-[acyl-carrier-protein] reductase FabG [Kluyvera cryocrescens]|uniref:3-oxoacyl-[acyl-carrier-protein] reductase FabG n=1 Tax=Kluyvera cryocrescens TaxID=580 RepID=A0A485CF53_KLUCR|nr:3-oxoacyl-[acyl-carrier-protein] reductase FabG [Kluyvera cryocrescens]
MFTDLKNKRVLITGSTAGMGLAAAQAFARQGAKVGINSHAPSPELEETLALLRQNDAEVEFFEADITRTDECRRLVEDFVARFGGLDVLGKQRRGARWARQSGGPLMTHSTNASWILNARSALMMTKFAIPHLRASAKARQETSCVISTGSIAGREGGGVGAGIYAASKAWLHDIHRNWVKEFTADGIRFNIVSPGTIDTAFHDGKSDALREKIAASIPMGRFGYAEEVAPAFLFFASHACKWLYHRANS